MNHGIYAIIGNLLKHYEMALFSMLMPFLAPLLFPDKGSIEALIYTALITWASMMARPLGAIFWGSIGDRYPRERTFFWIIVGMAFLSWCFVVSPLSPTLFLIIRLLQNFCSGGEVIGGAICALESLPQKYRNFYSSCYDAATVGGYLLASIGVYFVVSHDLSWRLLYALGGCTLLFALFVQKRPGYYYKPLEKRSFSVLKLYKKPLLLIMIVSGFSYSCAGISFVFMNSYIPLFGHFSKEEVLHTSSYLLFFDMLILPLFGFFALKVGALVVMRISALLVALCLPFIFLSLQGGDMGQMIAGRVIIIILAVLFSAPMHAFMQQLVPKEDRYKVVAMGYALGTQLLGAPTIAIALKSYEWFQHSACAAAYTALLGALCCITLYSMKEKRRDLVT
jgi:MHS family proline/betaine transporter-like MFS transporter